MTTRWRSVFPLVTAWSVVTVVTCLLAWPLPLSLTTSRPQTAFLDSYVWCLDTMARMVTGELPWSTSTSLLGFPATLDVRFVAWADMLVVLPLRGSLGPVGATNVAWLLSPGWAALAAFGFYRRLTRSGGWEAAAGAVAYALSPVALGCLASGQLSKLQHWTLPAWGWALMAVLEARRLGGELATLAAVTAIVGFTSPVHAMFLPVIGGIIGIVHVRGGGSGRTPGRLVLGVGVAALIAGAALTPARAYFGDIREASSQKAFSPANVQANQVFGPPSNVAQPTAYFAGEPSHAPTVPSPKHVPYMGVFGVCAVAALGVRRRPGRAVALGLVVAGSLLSFGPRLAEADNYLLLGDAPVWLPAQLLVLAHYPLSDSGMYYRCMFVAALGFGAMVAGSARLAPGRGGVVLSWMLGMLWAADGIRVTRDLWPRTLVPIQGRTVLDAMSSDPTPGAVLDLPIAHTPYQAGLAMLNAAFHRRAILATPRHGDPESLPQLSRAESVLTGVLAAEDRASAHQIASEAGFRYVTAWRGGLSPPGVPIEQLERALGRPEREGDLLVWTVDRP